MSGLRLRSSTACFTLSLLAVALVAASCAHTKESAPATRAAPPGPTVKQVPKELVAHGETRVDPYYWLRHREDPEVVAYLEAENAYAAERMRHTEPLQEQLYQEMLGRIQEDDTGASVPWGDYLYYERTEKGKQYPIHCRRRGPDAPEEILLDENVLAQGHEHFKLGAFSPSPDHRLLAYSADTTARETFTLYVKDLTSGELLADQIPGLFYGVTWANDGKTLFYRTQDDAWRPFKIFRHTLGQPADQDSLVYHETDERFWVWVEKTRSQAYIVIGSGSMVTSEARVIPADRPEQEPVLVQPRQQGVEYYLGHRGKRFYVVTNLEAQNFRVMTAPTRKPGQEQWQELVAHDPGVKIEHIELFAGHLVLFERAYGLPRIRVRDLDSGDMHLVEMPESVYTVWCGDNHRFDTNTLRFVYTSLVTPLSDFDYDMAKRTRTLVKEKPVRGGYDKAAYVTERIFAKAPDGVQVPISLVQKKGLPKDGSRPLYLHAYGAYGSSNDVEFEAELLPLLERGFTVAIAHVRGGGELGRAWYEDGKMLHKKNSFADFIACAEHLVAQGYTTPDKLVVQGTSAGGLLITAVTNMRPDLFRVVIAKVPWVDVVTTMFDESIPLTVTEYEEWGNPNEEAYYRYMLSYSPYDNLAATAYPSMLVTAGFNDPRVQYWEPAKYVAKLRTLKTDEHPLLLKTKMGSGHAGASGRYDRLHDLAYIYAFALDQLQTGG